MKDLILHSDSSFQPLGGVTYDNRQIVAQAFSFLFMTEIGSVPLAPELGTDLILGKTNVTSVRMQMQEAISNVFNSIRDGYGLTSADIESIESDGDTVKVKIKIEGENFSETLAFTI